MQLQNCNTIQILAAVKEIEANCFKIGFVDINET